jgi:RHS repeat-associated protein
LGKATNGIQYAYDAAGNVTSMTDYHGNTTTYTYTDRNELSTLTAPGSKLWTFHYNDIGQPTYYDIPNGMTTNYGYDSRNRLTAIEHKDGANVLDGFAYALDDVGNITSTTHEDGSFWEYLYDGRYRLTSAVRSNANETIEANYAYTYDAGDNLLTKVEPFEDDFNDGNYTGWSVWSGTWSAANNYVRKTPGAAGTFAKANTDNDNELRFSYVCNDTSVSGYTLTVSPRYASSGDRIYVNILPGSVNLAQRVSGVWSSLDAQALTSTQGVEYTIRVVCDGQNVRVFRTAPGALEELVLETASCTVASTNNVSFTPSLNADFEIDDIRVLSDDLSNTTTFAVNNANELTSMADYNGTTSFAFDAWGRMTSKARGSYEATYGYRYGQMLRSVTSDFPGEGNVTYEYGGDGKRRERVVSGNTTTYLWDIGYQVLNERDEYGTLTATHVLQFATIIGSNPSMGVYKYRASDALGSTNRIRSQGKSLLGFYEYGPFGTRYHDSGEEAESFTGHFWDESANAYLTAFRYYEPKLGRWTTRDPVGLLAGLNFYAYALNNPITYSDPLGLEGEKTTEKKKAKGFGYAGFPLVCYSADAINELSGVGRTDGDILPKTGAASKCLPQDKDRVDTTKELTEDAYDYTKDLLTDAATGVCLAQLMPVPLSGLKKLKKGIKKLQKAGVDVHDVKDDFGVGGDFDLYHDKDGNIFVGRKNGIGEGEPTGLNLNNLDCD